MVRNLWYRGETESLLWRCTQDFAAWRMSVSKSLVMIHYGITLRCYLLSTFPLNNFDVVCRSDQATYIISVGSNGRTTFMCGLFSLTLMVTSHIHVPFTSFVKVEPWSFLVSKDNWLALKMEICFPCCWDVGVCSFALLLNPCIPWLSG
jgi:hypothetical protein